jgi:hypothetical protein
MKAAIAILSGFIATLVAFAGGIVIAVVYLTAKPVPVQPLDSHMTSTWTREATSVNKEEQDYERLPPRVPAGDETADNDATSAQSVDRLTTAATPTGATPDKQPPTTRNAAHLKWCAGRYRSYDPADNSYRSYSGVQRECVSPYSDLASIEGSNNSDVAANSTTVSEANYSGQAAVGSPNSEHVQSCSDRYRSYRPKDNSYQPYSGGPRRQCE